MILEPWMGWAALLILLLLALSAFFSGSETALTATSRARMLSLEKEKGRQSRKAKRVNALKADGEHLIGAILLGNNLVNILASSIAAAVFLTMFSEAGVPVATIVMTLLVLIFAEVLPKTYALSNPDSVALRVSGPIKACVLSLPQLFQAFRRW